MDQRSEAIRLLSSRRKALASEGRRRDASPATDEQREIVEIDEALRRIENGTYGTCEACGGAIGRDRLRALPEVRHCVSCTR
jgi:RNA polymerase-binding transcription factor DksA